MTVIKWTDRNKSTKYRQVEDNREAHNFIKAINRVGLRGKIVDIENEESTIHFMLLNYIEDNNQERAESMRLELEKIQELYK